MRSFVILALLSVASTVSAAPDKSWYWEAGSVPALPVFVAFSAPRLGHHGIGNFISGVSHGGARFADGQVLVGKTGIGLMAENDEYLARKWSLRLFDTVQPVIFTSVAIGVTDQFALSGNIGRSGWFGQRAYWHAWLSLTIGHRGPR